jgi:hypothetical protein
MSLSSMALNAFPAKGRFEVNSAPPRRVPGTDLADLLHDLAFTGKRPVWKIGIRPDLVRGGPPHENRGLGPLPGVVVPRLGSVVGLDALGEPVLCSLTGHFQPRYVLRHRVALALETDHPTAREQLRPHDLAEWMRLEAAVLRDVVALDYDLIARHCRYDDVRTARSATKRGRRLWARLPAWPWRYFGDDGKPPGNWRADGGGQTLNGVFATWMTGEPHLLGSERRAS